MKKNNPHSVVSIYYGITIIPLQDCTTGMNESMNDLNKWLAPSKQPKPKPKDKQKIFDNIINSSEQCERCTSKATHVIDDVKLCLHCFEEYQNTRKGGMSFRWEWLNEYNRRKKDEKTNS